MSEDRIQIYQLASIPRCAPYRFDFARDHLNARKNLRVTRLTKFDEQVYQTILNSADILVVQRMPISRALARVCLAMNGLGKLIAYDIDDDLLHLHPDSRFAKLAPPDYGQSIKQGILACQAIQCSTRTLANVISEFHPEVTVLQNQLDAVMPYRKRLEDGPVVIGFAAGQDHYLDWLTIRDAFNRAIGQLEAEGYDLQTWIIGDQEVFESIESSNKRFFPMLPENRYRQFLQDIHISLIPLADILFNHSKSDVKFLESAASGAAVLASEVVYAESVQNGETGILFGNSDEFLDGLTALVKNPALVQRLSRNAHRYVAANRLIEQHVSRWEETYLRWHHNRGELLKSSASRRRFIDEAGA